MNFFVWKESVLHLCLLTFTSPISSMLVLVRLRVVMKYGLFHKPKNDVSKSKQQSSPFFPFDFSVIINYKRSSGNTGIGGTTLRGDTIFDAFLFYLLSILSSHHVCCCHCCLNSYWKKSQGEWGKKRKQRERIRGNMRNLCSSKAVNPIRKKRLHPHTQTAKSQYYTCNFLTQSAMLTPNTFLRIRMGIISACCNFPVPMARQNRQRNFI